MADVKVPIRFEIYKGDQLVREEILAQDVIKIGKLASSHLRLDDETVSRMHAVIETTGPERDPRRRPRLDPRDDASTASGSPRPACSRATRSCSATAACVVTFMEGGGRSGDAAAAGRAARSAGRLGSRRLRGGLRAAAAATQPSPRAGSPQPAAYQAAGLRAAAVVRRRRPAPAPRSRCTTARAPWRSRRSSAASSPGRATSSTPRGRRRTVRGRRCSTRARPRWCSPSRRSSPRRSTSAPRRSRTRPGRPPARSRRPSSGRVARRSSGGHRLRRHRRRHRALVHGPQAARQDEPELRHRLGRRRRRAGLARLRAVARRTRWSPRPAPTTSSTSRRA